MFPPSFRQLLLQLPVLSLSMCAFRSADSYLVQTQTDPSLRISTTRASPRLRMSGNGEEDSSKFGFGQRIESTKCAVVGGLAGSVAMAPISLLRTFVFLPPVNPLSQWEFDTDMGALEAALFAIVYRYCIRLDTNPQLARGCVGAFSVVRTLARIETPVYCSAIPLDCGGPFGYFDWYMVYQAAVDGAESAALFGAAAAAIDYVTTKGFLSKFPD